MYNQLAALENTWTWQLCDSSSPLGGYSAVVFSNRHSGHESNFVREIDLHWCEPDEIRAFAQELIRVAARIEASRSGEED